MSEVISLVLDDEDLMELMRVLMDDDADGALAWKRQGVPHARRQVQTQAPPSVGRSPVVARPMVKSQIAVRSGSLVIESKE